MAEQQELQLIITAQNKAMNELAKLSKDVQQVAGRQAEAGKASKGFGIELAQLAGAYLFVKNGIIDSLRAWGEQEKAMKQTEAVLASTNHAIGMSAKEIGDLATELQNVTPFADEVIQSGENLLLTFTNIGKDVFPQATETMLDMSAALGQDIKGSAIQLGKALQDPIRGVTALRKVGVNFNDTQMETIKHLVDTGKAMDAQKLILKELATEFGGSARKQLETFGGRMQWLKNQVGEVQEEIGKALVNSFTVMVKGANLSANGTVDAFAKVKAFISKWIPALIIGFKLAFQQIGTAIALVIEVIYAFGRVIVAKVKDAIENIRNLGGAFRQLGVAIKQVMEGDFQGAMATYNNLMAESSNNTKQAIDEEKAVIGELVNQFSTNATNALEQYDASQQMASQGADDFKGSLKDLGQTGAQTSKEIADKMKEAAKKIKDLKSEMKKAISEAKDDIKKFKKEFEKEEKEQEAELGTNIAKAFIEKQTEKADIEKQLNEETTEDNKTSLQAKLDEINAFFTKHTQDQAIYSEAIKREQEKAKMDSIELLKAEFAEEKEERRKDYETRLEELKDHLKEVKKEYKKRLKELKKEIKEEGLDAIKVKVSFEESKSSSKKSKRATGGSVMSGHEYIVGENGAEVFVPSVSGSIEKPSSFAGGKSMQINFNFSGAVIGDKASLMREIEAMLNRKQEVIRLGMR